MASAESSAKVVYAALAGNLLIAVTKFIAAAWTGSSAMLSEGVHSVVDSGNQVLLLYGRYRAGRPPDEHHPLGHGRELYFWSFIVALLIFSLGAGISFYEGVTHIRHPTHIQSPTVNYIVLALSFIFESVSFGVAFREFDGRRGTAGYWEAVRRSKDPTSFIVLFEDGAALIGLVIAFAGTLAGHLLEEPLFDGMASIGIAVVLAATAIVLARESKGLLIGEPAGAPMRRALHALAGRQPGVARVGRVITVHLGPDQVVAALELDFADQLSASDIESSVSGLERQLQDEHPELVALFVKPKAIERSGNPSK